MKVIYREGANAETGVVQFCSWRRAHEMLKQVASCRDDESIEAVNITDHGFEFFICKASDVSTNPKATVTP